MSDEKTIEYDYQSTISFVSSQESILGLLGGFLFAGIILIISGLEEPVAPLSQVVLFIFSQAMALSMMTIWELHFMNISVCMKSSKPIIPNYPARWRIINTFTILVNLLSMIGTHLMFLLKNLIILFVLSLCISAIGFLWVNIHWKRIEVRMR